MFLHIGNNNIIPFNKIIMMINLETIKKNNITKEFLELAKAEKRVKGNPLTAKSCILTNKYIYYTYISAATLEKRCLMLWENINK